MLVQKFFDVAQNYDIIILDAYGVFSFSKGIEPKAAETMKELRKRGKKVFILSNSSAVAVDLEADYYRHGLLRGVHYDKLITSGEYASSLALQGALPVPGTKMYVLGTANFGRLEDKVPDLFKGTIYTVTDGLQDADFVYLGIPQIDGEDRIMLEDFMPEIAKCWQLDKTALCCNPDLRANEGGRFVVRPGMIYQVYKLLGGKARIYGKPDPKIFEFLLKDVIADCHKILMVGDTLQTDILGAKRAGIDSCLTLRGGMEEYLLCERGKTMTGENLENRFAEIGIFPDYVVSAIY